MPVHSPAPHTHQCRPTPTRGFSLAIGPGPRGGLLTVGLVGVLALAICVLAMTTGIGLPCIFRDLTGWDCPFCGGTRAGVAVLHGQWQAAWNFNAVALIGAGVVAVRSIGWIVELIHPPASGEPVRWIPTRWVNPCWIAVAVALVAFTVFRNL